MEKEFERSVLKGSKALKIWAPISYKAKDKDGKELLDKMVNRLSKKVLNLFQSLMSAKQTAKKFQNKFMNLKKKCLEMIL